MENSEKIKDFHGKLIDLELVKSDNKNSKIRRYLPAVILTATFYYSFLISLGLLFGYLVSKLFSKYFLEQGKVDSIFIDCGKWKIHMHHWILGAVFLIFVWVLDFLFLPSFFVGVVLGVIAHDIYDYNDWHKVLVKNEESIK